MIKQIRINIGELQFDCRVAGNDSDPLVILLHGFPETSHMWTRLMADLVRQNFYCLAPNMRGYSSDARPKRKKDYHIDNLEKDILGIADEMGRHKFHLIGHDWGAAVGWKVVVENQERVISWTAMSVPHIQAFGSAIFNDPEQYKMSAYIRAFRVPYLPEWRIGKKDFHLLKKFWKYSSDEEVEDYLLVFRQKGALTAAINYYRGNYAVLKRASHEDTLGPVSVPTLFIWGENDIAIGPAAVENGHKMVRGPYQFLKLDAGHWLIQTRYEEVSAAIMDHLRKYNN